MNTSTLQMEGADVVVHRQSTENAKDHFLAVIEVKLHPGLPALAWRSVPTTLHADDVRRLIAYLDEHGRKLRVNPDREAAVFVPRELGFQVRALGGDLDAAGEGEFTLSFFVNIGQCDGCSRTYVGAEAAVDAAKVRRFTDELDAFFSEPAGAGAAGVNGIRTSS